MKSYTVVCDSTEREYWLNQRTNGIGASEASILLGVNRWGSQLELYAKKVGAVPSGDSGQVAEHLVIGSHLEEPVAELYEQRTGRKVRPCGELLRSTRHDWAICTPDYWVVRDDGPDEPLEIKAVGSARIADWKDGVPPYYAAQVQHQLLVTGQVRGHIAVLTASPTWKLYHGTLERDDEMIAKIIEAGERFWTRVETKDPPPPDDSESATDALKKLYPEGTGEVIALPTEAMQWDEELQEIKAEVKGKNERKRFLENQIKAAIGSASVGTCANGITFTLTRKHVPAATIERKAYDSFTLRRKASG